MSFFSKSFELLYKMILSLCVVFMYFELKCVDGIFYEDIIFLNEDR